MRLSSILTNIFSHFDRNLRTGATGHSRIHVFTHSQGVGTPVNGVNDGAPSEWWFTNSRIHAFTRAWVPLLMVWIVNKWRYEVKSQNWKVKGKVCFARNFNMRRRHHTFQFSPFTFHFINMRRRHHTFEAKLRNASTLLRLGITSKLVLLSP